MTPEEILAQHGRVIEFVGRGAEPPPPSVTDNSSPAIEETAPAFSDEALALRFAERHAGDLRFVAAWNRWLFWNGMHWQFEETLRAWDFARQVCREAAAQCNKGRTASAIASAKTVYAVERLARSDRRIAATIDQWDADPWLLNTPDGVIDLRTGQTRAHHAEDYHDQDHGCWAARRLSALSRLPRSDHRRRQRTRRLYPARPWLRAYGPHTRACAVFRLRDRRKRQERFAFNRRRNTRRIPQDRADRDLHRDQQRSSSDRSRRPCAARASSPRPKPRRADGGQKAASSS